MGPDTFVERWPHRAPRCAHWGAGSKDEAEGLKAKLEEARIAYSEALIEQVSKDGGDEDDCKDALEDFLDQLSRDQPYATPYATQKFPPDFPNFFVAGLIFPNTNQNFTYSCCRDVLH